MTYQYHTLAKHFTVTVSKFRWYDVIFGIEPFPSRIWIKIYSPIEECSIGIPVKK